MSEIIFVVRDVSDSYNHTVLARFTSAEEAGKLLDHARETGAYNVDDLRIRPEVVLEHSSRLID